MESSNIPDANNFDLLIQEIPGTYNSYDRENISEELNLTLPQKIKINNWDYLLRWKNFQKFPPRPRNQMIANIDDLPTLQSKISGDLTTTPSDFFNKIVNLRFPMSFIGVDGVKDDSKDNEELSLIEIINDDNKRRKIKRLQELKSKIFNMPNINRQPQVIPNVPNQQLISQLVDRALRDALRQEEEIISLSEANKRENAMNLLDDKGNVINVVPEKDKDRIRQIILDNPDATIEEVLASIDTNETTYEKVMRDNELQQRLSEKFGQDYNEFMTLWSENNDITLDLNKSKDNLVNDLMTKIGPGEKEVFTLTRFEIQRDGSIYSVVRNAEGQYVETVSANIYDFMDYLKTLKIPIPENVLDLVKSMEAEEVKEEEEEEEELMEMSPEIDEEQLKFLFSTYTGNESIDSIGLPGNPEEFDSDYYKNIRPRKKIVLIRILFDAIKSNKNESQSDWRSINKVSTLQQGIRNGRFTALIEGPENISRVDST